MDGKTKLKWDARVQKSAPNKCWLWCGGRSGQYGSFTMNGKNNAAHRVAWEMSRGAIPAGMFALHSCDTPLCVNPRHLFLGTKKDNAQDKIKKGRRSVHQWRGKNLNPLQRWRALSGLSLRAVAKHVGRSQQAVWYWETGQHGILEKSKPLLASLYGCSVDELTLDPRVALERRGTMSA